MSVDLATPCLVVDLDVLDGNISLMARLAAEHGLALRPHAKTHKSPAIARRQLDAGAVGLTVATVSEAEVFAAAGCTDLFLAYPVYASTEVGARLRQLLERARVRVRVGVDSIESARALAAQVGACDGRLSVLVEVDSGQHRTGVPPEDAGELAAEAAHAGLDVAGVFTFPGHSYAPEGRQRAADDEQRALATAAAALRGAGVEPRVVSGGSTPSAALVHDGTLTELRPGVYVFGDAQQWELGSITPDRIALTCLATVVSHAGGRVVLDSGSKALGADRAPWATGHGRLLDHPDARIVQLSEHHAVVDWTDDALPEIGSRVRVVPNHVCNAVNAHDTLVVTQNGALVDRWPVAARGANT